VAEVIEGAVAAESETAREERCRLEDVSYFTVARTQNIARMIARAAAFAIEIPMLDSIVEASAAGVSSTAVADGRMRDLLGSSLSMERAAAFAREILSRRIAGADARRAVACTGIPKKQPRSSKSSSTWPRSSALPRPGARNWA
jgi:hypothetical protein